MERFAEMHETPSGKDARLRGTIDEPQARFGGIYEPQGDLDDPSDAGEAIEIEPPDGEIDDWHDEYYRNVRRMVRLTVYKVGLLTLLGVSVRNGDLEAFCVVAQRLFPLLL